MKKLNCLLGFLLFTAFITEAQIKVGPIDKRGLENANPNKSIPGQNSLGNMISIPSNKMKTYGEFLITAMTPWENTLAAIEPTPNSTAKAGRLILSAGQNIAPPIITRNIFNTSGAISSLAGNSVGVSFPALDSANYGTDNQIVRLKDGSLLQMRNSNTWKKMSGNPYWANYKIIDNIGNRGSTMFWRSTDNGDSWKLLSTIDFGSKDLQKYGAPRPMDCAGKADVSLADQCKDPSKRTWWIGGGDRPELYVCPYTGFVYLTTRVIANINGKPNHVDNYLLFFSTDNAKTWTLAKSDLPPFESVTMTSTPDGRLFLFQENGNVPTVYVAKMFSNPFIKLNAGKEYKLNVSEGFPVYYVHSTQNKITNISTKTNVICEFPDSLGNARIDRLGVGTGDIARSSESTKDNAVVYAAYQSKNAKNNQEYRIVKIEMVAGATTPTVSNVFSISGEDPANYSAMHGSFIQPNFVNTPSNISSGLTMFYWMEIPRAGTGKNDYKIKYIFLNKDKYTSPAILSSFNFNGAPSEGDYLRGGFYYYNGQYNYVPQWTQSDGVHCNIVGVDVHALD